MSLVQRSSSVITLPILWVNEFGNLLQCFSLYLYRNVFRCFPVVIVLVFYTLILSPNPKGPSIKYVTLEGEGVRKGVTVCDRGGGPRACDVTLLKKFHTYET